MMNANFELMHVETHVNSRNATVELGAVIGIVYEAAAAVEAWPSALTAIADALNAHTVSLTIIDKSGAVPLIHVAPRTGALAQFERSLTKDEAITLARIERGVPALMSARDLVERFHRMVRDRDPAVLPALIGDLVASISHPLAKASPPIGPRSPQRWSKHGQTAKPKVRSLSSSSSNGRCTDAPNWTCSALA